MNTNDMERFVTETDAKSRIAIDFTNNSNSRRIALYGDLTHDTNRGGFILPDGKTAVSSDASCVQDLHNSWFPVQTPMPFSLVPMPMSAIPLITPFSPYDVTNLLLSLDPQYDFIGICRRLKLDKRDFDTITIKKGNIIRSFADDNKVILSNCLPIPTFDHLGSFERMYVLFGRALFELKTFKFWDRHGPYQFLFRPKHSGLWFRDGIPAPGGTIILDTDILAVYNNNSPAKVGLIDAGDIAKIDWKLLRGLLVQYVWGPGIFQSRDRLAAALHFLGEAKENDIHACLITPEGQIIDVPAAIVHARRYGLDIPSVLKKIGYVQLLTPQENYIPHDIPAFWSKGSATLFFGPGFRMILEKLVKAFTRIQDTATDGVDKQDNRSRFPSKQVGIYYQASTESRIKKMIGNTGLSIPCISSAISLDELETALYQKAIQVLFIPYAEKIPAQVLADVLDLCELKSVVVGVFSRAEGKNGKSIPEDVLSDTTKELVAQCYLISTDGDAVIARDVTTGTTKRYFFEDDGKVSIADEININNTNRKEI